MGGRVGWEGGAKIAAAASDEMTNWGSGGAISPRRSPGQVHNKKIYAEMSGKTGAYNEGPLRIFPRSGPKGLLCTPWLHPRLYPIMIRMHDTTSSSSSVRGAH